MGRIAVFDSGLGSLSVIRPIQRLTRAEIIYFADQRNYPYGLKTRARLEGIIRARLEMLESRFAPDIIVIGSNTPTLLLPHLTGGNVIGVTPPLREAARLSKSGSMAILATESVVRSPELSGFVRAQNLPQDMRVFKINASPLVDLVESGIFLTDPARCAGVIRESLGDMTHKNRIDVMTLSSTHLPFLADHLAEELPGVRLVDPADRVARLVRDRTARSDRSTLSVYTSSSPEALRARLARLGVHDTVTFLD